MERDDVPVVGAGGPQPASGSAPSLGRVGLAVTVVVAAVAVVAAGTSIDGPAQPRETFPEMPTEAATTLEWRIADGLSSARHIYGLLRVGGRYLAVGTSEAGVRTWTSADGESWTLSPPFPATDEHSEVTGVTATEDRVIVTTTTYDSGTYRRESVLWWSEDGEIWSAIVLRSPEPNWIEARADDVAVAGDTLVVQGTGGLQPDPNRLHVDLPPGIERLLEEDLLDMVVGGRRLEFLLDPGRVVHSIPLGDLGPGVIPFGGRGPIAWVGDDLTPTTAPDAAGIVGVRGDGAVVGRTPAGGTVITTDGRDWAPTDIDLDGTEHVPLGEGTAAIDTGGASIVAVDTDGSRSTLWELPPAAGDSTELTDLAAGAPGVVAIAETRRDLTEPEIVVAGDDDTILVLGGDHRIEVLDGGTTAFYGTTATAPLRLDPVTGIVEVVDPISGTALMEMSVERWVRALREGRAGSERLASARLLHSPDGETWTDVGWETISATTRLVDPDLLVAADVVMAVDQGVDGGPIVGAWIGRRASGTD